MLQKKVFWVAYTFLQKPSSFKFLSILEENCGADINNGTIKCKFLLTNVSKNGRWVSYTFLQKLSSFKFYSILEENFVVQNTQKFIYSTVIYQVKMEYWWNSIIFGLKMMMKSGLGKIFLKCVFKLLTFFGVLLTGTCY